MTAGRTIAVVAWAAGALASAVATPAAEPALERIGSGVVAAHMAGRVVVGLDGECQVLGYYTFIDGLGTPFAAGDPGESTALFSVRSEPFRFRPVLNGTTVHLLGQPVSGDSVALNVYYDPAPDRDYAYPETFSTGALVATFRPRGGMATLTQAGTAAFAGTLDLISSAPFAYGGQTIDLHALGDLVTVELTGEAPVASGPYLGLAFPFGGPVIAAGDHPFIARGVRARLHGADR